MAASQQPNQPKTNELRRSEIAAPLTTPDNRVTRLSRADLCAGIFARGEAMFDDFDPRDRDDDVRDIEMPWIELGRGPASDREADDPRDRDEDIRDRDRDRRDRDSDPRAVTLTERGRHLLETHRRDRDDQRPQSFYADVSRPRELSHDAHLYSAYLREEERLREQGADVHRVVLDHELKREYQEWLQEGN